LQRQRADATAASITGSATITITPRRRHPFRPPRSAHRYLRQCFPFHTLAVSIAAEKFTV
jgi:hypothetical protein